MYGITSLMWNDSHWREPSIQSAYQPALGVPPESGIAMMMRYADEKLTISVLSVHS